MENYIVAMGVTAGIFALMALGLNVIWGMAGLINLGLVGFFAVGAYVSALLTIKLLKHGTLKVYKGFPHGMCTTHADVVNAELLKFFKS